VAPTALAEWLQRLEQRAPEARIELGLDRVRIVLDRLTPSLKPPVVLTVGGTNGKGSVVAFCESMALAAGYRTFAYTSPHLIDFSERFRVDGKPAAEASIVAALETVEAARGSTFLTYFEHTTLAGFVLAAHSTVDIWILEVGLGGRLDAVNILDPDVSVITSIGLDHTEWLGPTRLHVAREKAGIARAGRPLIVGERRRPRGFDAVLEHSGAKVWRIGKEFRSRRSGDEFTLSWLDQRLGLPMPSMRGAWQQSNAAAAAMAAILLRGYLPIPDAAIAEGLRSAQVIGRLQRVARTPEVILDVAHNPAAARALAGFLEDNPRRPTIVVFSALRDKDVGGVGRALRGSFDHWLVPPLASERATPPAEIVERLIHAGVTRPVNAVESLPLAVQRARTLAGPEGRVVVFGSFRTVAAAWPLFGSD
jgi:dihydrofolate synthase/folylpolyglutamate synthase